MCSMFPCLRKMWEYINVNVTTSLPTIPVDDGPIILSPQAILEHRKKKGRNEVLVHWQGLFPANAT